MKQFPVVGVGDVGISRCEVVKRNNRAAEAHPGTCKGTGEQQLYVTAGKSWVREEAAFAMSIPMDLCSTEDHGYHLPE
jgi:hypothetical protein